MGCEVRIRKLLKNEGKGYRVSIINDYQFLDYKDFKNKSKAEKYAKSKCKLGFIKHIS